MRTLTLEWSGRNSAGPGGHGGDVARAALLLFPMFASIPASSARAQGDVLHLRARGPIDGERLRAALERELGRRVVLGRAGTPQLSVSVRADGRGSLRYVAADGTRRRRDVQLPADRGERLRELTLFASNLVRDQTSDLIAPPPGSEPAAVERAGNLALERPFHLGLSGSFGLTAREMGGASNVQVFGAYGLLLSGTVDRMVSVGVTRLAVGAGFSSLEGAIFSLEMTPMVELFGFPDPRVQVYGQLGLAVQGRTQTSFREEILQLAPFLGGGVRFWIADWFSLGLELGLHLVLTDAYRMGSAVLPQWSLPGTLGSSVAFHIR